ncbi:MAG TPA: C4-dicarboxylate ABC transporter, partial [Syntrophobacteraceae bacterium]|nr:C4-dicarboxylate ABC transporter [Syntrophobacteraceae bacterium]
SPLPHLSLAGLLPGLVMFFLLVFYSMFKSPTKPVSRVRYSGREILAGLVEAAWELPLAVIILGGIYGGIFMASEA